MTAGMERNDTMFSVREAPWHNLGTVLDDYPDKADAMSEAGLSWTVDEFPLWSPRTHGWVEGWKALARSDDQSILHVAKDSYGVVQNGVGFDIAEAMMDQDKAVLYETAGSIKGGATCYITCRVDEPVTIDGDDSVTFPYVVVTWSHDGTAALRARATNVRVVCWNTLSASEAEAKRTGREFTFRHSAKVMERIEDAKQTLMGVRGQHAAFVELANELARIPIEPHQRELFVERFIPAPSSDYVISDKVLDNINEARTKVRSLFNGDSIPEAHRDSAYGLLLAGSEYLDHLRGYRSSDTYLGRTLLKDDSLKAKLTPLIYEVASA